jgi:hypothetical protein
MSSQTRLAGMLQDGRYSFKLTKRKFVDHALRGEDKAALGAHRMAVHQHEGVG